MGDCVRDWLSGLLWPIFFARKLRWQARDATLLWTLAACVEKQLPLVPFLESLADENGGFPLGAEGATFRRA